MGLINSNNLVEVVQALEMYRALVGGNMSRFWFNLDLVPFHETCNPI
jgi:hypothetical protein